MFVKDNPVQPIYLFIILFMFDCRAAFPPARRARFDISGQLFYHCPGSLRNTLKAL